MNRTDLHQYQHHAHQFAMETPFCALWLDMGLGKTVITLTAIADLFDRFEISKVLIIGTVRVAETVWRQEIANWDHVKHLTHTLLRGKPAERKALCHEDTQIHIINREMFRWLVEQHGSEWPYDMVVIDEATSFKSHASKRWRAMCSVRRKITRMVQLTGTPTNRGLLDLWAQIYLLDLGERLEGGARLGTGITRYRAKYFEKDYSGFQWNLKSGNDKVIHAKVKDICLSMDAEDHITMPERIDSVIRLELPASVRADYRELEKEFLLEINATDTVLVPNAAVLVSKLAQIANGALYIGEGADRVFTEMHSAKLDALGEIVDEANGAPVLVGYNFKSAAVLIKDRFPKAVGVWEKDAINRWNTGEVPMLIAHPAMAAHGLNLQHGGHIVAWFGVPWSLELYQQFNARLFRQGQKNTVSIHHLIMARTVEETTIRALRDRLVTRRDLFNATRRDIERRN